MGRSNENKGSTPKIAKSPAEQDAIRRAAKQNRRRGAGKGISTAGNGYLAGRAEDKLKAETCALMDALDSKLHSPAPQAHSVIRDMFAHFMDTYYNAREEELRRTRTFRAEYALTQTLQKFNSSITEFAGLEEFFSKTVRATSLRVRHLTAA